MANQSEQIILNPGESQEVVVTATQNKSLEQISEGLTNLTSGISDMASQMTEAMGGITDAINKVAVKYKKTPAQIILRWHIQSGFITIPKSVRAERIKENFEIFDFELTDEEMNEINKLDGKKGRIQYNSFIMKVGMWLLGKPKD